MTINIAINGFGRMGRLALRLGLSSHNIIHINETAGDVKTAAHLLEFDSVHGRWTDEIHIENDTILCVNKKEIRWSSTEFIQDIPLKEQKIDVVIDCTGVHKTVASLQPYFEQGVKKVIVSSPIADKSVLNIVYGINESLFDPKLHAIITAASCTTNALAPIVKTIQDGLGIKHGSITTIHDVTNTQSVMDTFHKDLRRARSNATSLIPTTTGSAKAIFEIFPELKGKLNSLAIRVPIQNSSLIDCVFEVNAPTSVGEVSSLLKTASETNLKGILGYEERPLVSVDYVNDSRSSIIDALSTMVINETQIKLISWYDNEWGYVSRMVDLVAMVSSSL
jgi:glyceraldehyde 3-phosphate dehydrogenase